MTRIGSFLIALLLAGACIAAPGFKAPMKAGPPFRRDRLPIDPDRMSELAGQLNTLASGCGSNLSPGGLRAAAQLLALSQALRPTDRDSAELISRLRKGELPKPPGEEPLSRARSIAWQHAGWLASSEAGQHANLLAACLVDALAVADPNQPQAAALRDRGEQGRWDGWVAPPEAFGANETPEPKPDPSPPVKPDPDTNTDPGVDDPPQGAVPFQLETAQVMLPMWVYHVEQRESDFGVVPLAIKTWSEPLPAADSATEASPTPKAVPQYYVGFRSESLDKSMRPTFDNARQAVATRHGGLPMRGRGLLSLPGGGSYTWKNNRETASAAIALLMDAALSGKAPGSDVIVLGSIDSSGALKPSWRLWDRLRWMAKDEELRGGRLILPREAAPMLESLLVMGKAHFFIRYEVLLAGSLTELVERATAEPAGDHAAAAKEFAQIRTASKDQLIGPFLANRFVRERLDNILKTFPDHASARMALLQGSGERPDRLSTPILAAELRDAISPMSWMPQIHDVDELTADRVTEAHKECRERLDPVEDLVARDDLELWESTFELVQAVRTFSYTLKRVKGDYYYTKREEARKAAASLNSNYHKLNQQLLQLSGEEVDTPPQVKPRPATGQFRQREE